MPLSSTLRPGRAAPLPAAERRAAIVAAALPLLAEHGQDVTTRQIAEAAGIAEGTIFRVFADKAALIEAAVETAFDAAPALARIAAIDPSLPLRDRLIAAIEVLRTRLQEVWRLMSALRLFGPPGPRPNHPTAHHDESGRIDAALTALLLGSAAELRTSPEFAARAVRLLVFSATHPRIANGDPLDTAAVADLLLDGIRSHAH